LSELENGVMEEEEAYA
jgi:hypothetical protein